MHGLTKKKSYGVKAPKKTYSDIHLPMAGRPILPRLEVPQSDIYSYPSFDNTHGPEPRVLVSDSQSPPSRRHSDDQLPPTSLVTRTGNDDRRARRWGPWLPIAPLASSTPSSPTSVTSPGTLAALQSLASMTPRLPDFATKGRGQPPSAMSAEAQDLYASYGPGSVETSQSYSVHPAMASRLADSHAPYPASPPQDPQLNASPTYFYSRVPGGTPQWSQQGSVGASPASSASAPSPSHTSASGFSDTSRQYSDFGYGSSPPTSAAVTPISVTAPATARMADNSEDQPFIITPEIVAKSDADMEEVLRSGALQANMTPGMCGGVGVQQQYPSPMFASSESLSSPDQYYYPALASPQSHAVHQQDGGYPVYHHQHHPHDVVHMNAELSHADGGQWQYGGGQNGYMPPVQDYIPNGHWYPS